jgi:phosphoribosylaminoimidazole-succinocarboxamide synthase
MIPIECVARGFLYGSAWRDYCQTGVVSAQRIPAGMRLAERLPEPLFTPALKNDSGHDINISFPQMITLVGEEASSLIRDISLALYSDAARRMSERGLILADTKFEFGMLGSELILGDEILTPDSSRYWIADSWSPGRHPVALDRQIVRDWLDRAGPQAAVPESILRRLGETYRAAYERVTGHPIQDWYDQIVA